MNIVDELKRSITDDVIEKLCLATGNSHTEIKRIADHVIPGLLACLANQATTENGAELLHSVLVRFVPSPTAHSVVDPADNLRGVSGAIGADLISSIIDGDSINTFALGISRLTRIPTAQIKTGTSFLAPILLASLRSQLLLSGMDVSNRKQIVEFFQSQQANINDGMPSGFSVDNVEIVKVLGDGFRSAQKLQESIERNSAPLLPNQTQEHQNGTHDDCTFQPATVSDPPSPKADDRRGTGQDNALQVYPDAE